MPSDQLFFVFESDHRFYEADCIRPQEWLKVCGQDLSRGPAADTEMEEQVRPMSLDTERSNETVVDLTLPGPTLSAVPQGMQPGSSSDPPGRSLPTKTARTQAEPLAGRDRKFTPCFGAWEYGGKAQGREVQVSDELTCLVRLRTQAQRIGRGDLVWYSWNGSSSKRKAHPHYGSQMIGITKAGAAALASLLQRTKPGHFDVVLLTALVDGSLTMGASYVYPAIGNFTEHQSGCDPSVGVRGAHWGENFVLDGVRTLPGKERYIMGFCKKGTDWGPKVDFDAHDFVWKTLAPPDNWWDWDHTMQQMLRSRNWVNEHGTEWWGPQKGKTEGKKGKGDGKLKGRPSRRPSEYDLLRQEPSSHLDMCGAWSPISRLASELVVDETNLPWDAEQTARFWTTRRAQLSLYKRRIFTVDRA